ncbi:AraC family transcriptional regulator [Stappia sp.]|uniref:helix-turn-helix transcriptional regulator n=1 Tax=Stappia sp. TaxID=1870903 RepID=UPI003C79D355
MLKRLDRLSALIDRFRIEATVVPAVEAGIAPAAETPGANLFLLMGPAGRPANDVRGGCLVFRPRSGGGRPAGAIAVAAHVDLGGDVAPFALALPEEVRIALCDAPALAAVAEVLLDEVMRPRCGGQAILDRLCEIVVVRLLRHAIEQGGADSGLIAGLAHPQLAAALVAMHEAPGRAWRLEDLAAVSGMSRTAFATGFRDVVGRTPGAYLHDWRMSVARQEIARGVPLKAIASRVGFSSAAAFSRAYSRAYGHAPRFDKAERPDAIGDQRPRSMADVRSSA